VASTLREVGGPPGPPAPPITTAAPAWRRFARSGAALGLLLVAPVVLYLLALQAYPFISAFLTSLTDKRIGTPGAFVGLDNYAELLRTPLFRKAVVNTFIFTAGSIGVKLVLGMVMALVLNQNLIFKNLWRALLFLPWTIPTIVTVLTFSWMYSPTGGVFNTLLLKSGILERPIDWLGRPANAMIAVILVNIWRGTPFFGISLLGALQGVPQEQYEAAELDGANVLQRFRYVTLPSIRDVALLVTMVSTIWTLNDFQIIWVLTRGGPANTTQVFSTLTYTTAFENLYLARAIAISVFSVPILALIIGWITRAVLPEND
jgi:multiple sugar transport system permease protein